MTDEEYEYFLDLLEQGYTEEEAYDIIERESFSYISFDNYF